MKHWTMTLALLGLFVFPAQAYKDCPDVDMSGVEWSQTRVSEKGRGYTHTRPLGFRAGNYRFSYEYGGRASNFIVWMHTRRDQRDLLVNRIGSGKDAFPVRLECDDEVWFEIKAYGPWKVFFERDH